MISQSSRWITVLSSVSRSATKLYFRPVSRALTKRASLHGNQIYRAQKIINYASVKERGRLLSTARDTQLRAK